MTSSPVRSNLRASPLGRMRTYTTASLLVVIGFYCLVAVSNSDTLATLVVSIVAGLVVTEFARHWERRGPAWHTALAVIVSLGAWVYTVNVGFPFGMLYPTIVLAILVSQLRRWFVASLIGLVVLFVPVAITALIAPSDGLVPLALVAFGTYWLMVGLFMFNRYGFGLYLEIDAARTLAADLAVSEERYRFAADLHDIQGHTLHVIKLKTQLAHKLIERDPDAAREHLAEAQALIAETLANTKNLAYGKRTVTLASEIANAEQLFTAAGISWDFTGTVAPGEHDEILGLVMREATTNILRHSQATSVSVIVEAHRLRITNNGSAASTRALSGLARLGDEFAKRGGSLTTHSAEGTFVTEATLS